MAPKAHLDRNFKSPTRLSSLSPSTAHFRLFSLSLSAAEYSPLLSLLSLPLSRRVQRVRATLVGRIGISSCCGGDDGGEEHGGERERGVAGETGRGSGGGGGEMGERQWRWVENRRNRRVVQSPRIERFIDRVLGRSRGRRGGAGARAREARAAQSPVETQAEHNEKFLERESRRLRSAVNFGGVFEF